jgi:hypothetical protein
MGNSPAALFYSHTAFLVQWQPVPVFARLALSADSIADITV